MVINEIEQKEIIEGFKGRFIHMKSFTIAFWEVEKDAEIPLHSHVHEQTTQVIEGKFEMTVDNVTKVYEPGMIVTIPSFIEHGGKALTNCKLTDVFCPVREEYK